MAEPAGNSTPAGTTPRKGRRPQSHLGKFLRSAGWGVLLRPRVITNHRLNQREKREGAVVMRSYPPKVEVEISGRCNLRCIHCFRRYTEASGDERFMPPDKYRDLLRQLPYTVTLTLTGAGESLLHPQIGELLGVTRKVLPHANVLMYSNLHLLGRTISAEELVASGVGQVHVSLDAATPETYHQVRGADVFEQVLSNIRALLTARESRGARRPLVGVNFTMMRDNFREAPQYVALAHELGVDYIARPSLIATQWGYKDGAEGMTPTALIEVMHQTRQVAEDLGAAMATDGYVSDPEHWFRNWNELRANHYKGCIFFRDAVQFDAYGEFRLCCLHPRASQHSWGNVFERPFKEIWNSPQIVEARRRQATGQLPVAPCAETCVKADPPLSE